MPKIMTQDLNIASIIFIPKLLVRHLSGDKPRNKEKIQFIVLQYYTKKWLVAKEGVITCNQGKVFTLQTIFFDGTNLEWII